MPFPRTPIERRFWDKLDMSRGPDSCWEWQASRQPYGYGKIGGYDAQDRPVLLSAHRVAWELTNGRIPEGSCVCHRCDNPPCCNPAHLFLGTHRDNAIDKSRKGRAPKGTEQKRAKLTDEAVREIRASSSSQSVLAKRYGVTQGAIWMARHRLTWKHVR